MDIILYHKHYDKNHLASVKNEMETLGAPEIKAIWSEVYGAWLAIEGCHRIRAAKELGITPTIIDVSDLETVAVQIDGEDVNVTVPELAIELTDDAYKSEMISFG